MADREYSSYQRKIISRYYDNREQMDEQRLTDLVAELYLSEGKKRAKLWVTAQELMGRLYVPAKRIEHVIASDDPTILAAVVNDLRNGLIKPPPPGETPEGAPAVKSAPVAGSTATPSQAVSESPAAEKKSPAAKSPAKSADSPATAKPTRRKKTG